jgi:O-antigen/teichoic acid export membrane protein
MSRFRKAVHGVASGYVSLAAAAVYSLAILPLGLKHLSPERLGLWTLMNSIAGYLSQIDLGMSSSLARLLIDHKDDRQSCAYGSLIKTGWLVLAAQGILVAIVGFLIAPPLASLLQIESELRPEFISLLRWMTASWALGFATRIFSHLLQAHQRMDLVNYMQVWNLAVGFVLMWVLLAHGVGVIALAWVTLLVSSFGNLMLLIFCWRLHLFPHRGFWGRASWNQFRTIFLFGKDIFLVSVGAQLIVASQPLIITRQLGIASATLWYAGTRVFNLVSQAIWRLSDASMPAFAEMMVRDEKPLLRERYKTVVIVTASFAGFAAVSYVLSNSLFVGIWTSLSKKHEFFWPSGNDLLLGVWMIVMAVLHCHNVFILTTKQVGFMRYFFCRRLHPRGCGACACKTTGPRRDHRGLRRLQFLFQRRLWSLASEQVFWFASTRHRG